MEWFPRVLVEKNRDLRMGNMSNGYSSSNCFMYEISFTSYYHIMCDGLEVFLHIKAKSHIMLSYIHKLIVD